MSKSRAREAAKIDTPQQQWNALTGAQRAAVLALRDDEDELVGLPYHIVQGLLDWWIVKPTARGYAPTANGIATRDYGRSIQP